MIARLFLPIISPFYSLSPPVEIGLKFAYLGLSVLGWGGFAGAMAWHGEPWWALFCGGMACASCVDLVWNATLLHVARNADFSGG